jgi:hypothetical protein
MHVLNFEKNVTVKNYKIYFHKFIKQNWGNEHQKNSVPNTEGYAYQHIINLKQHMYAILCYVRILVGLHMTIDYTESW